MTGITVIPQRSNTDCSICCTAMALNKTYEEIFAVVGDDLGWDGQRFDDVFEHFGYDVIAQPRMFKPLQPAIFSVPSKLVDGNYHAVYYALGQIADPTTQTTPYSLREVLVHMHSVYQWTWEGV